MSFSEVSNVIHIPSMDISQWQKDGLDSLIYEPRSSSARSYLLNLVKEVTAPIFALMNVTLNLLVAGVALVGSAMGLTSGPQKHVSVLVKDCVNLLLSPYTIFLAFTEGPSNSLPAMPPYSAPYVPNLDTSSLQMPDSDIPNRTVPYLKSTKPEDLKQFESKMMEMHDKYVREAELSAKKAADQLKEKRKESFGQIKECFEKVVLIICRSAEQDIPEDSSVFKKDFLDKMDQIRTDIDRAKSRDDVEKCLTDLKEFCDGLPAYELEKSRRNRIVGLLAAPKFQMETYLKMQEVTKEIY